MLTKGEYHTPALLNNAVELLKVEPGKKYIDATLGGGGHSLKIMAEGGELLAIDRDPEAIAYVRGVLKACPGTNQKIGITAPPPPKIVRGNFAEIEKIAKENGFEKVDGILFDLGVSSHQLKNPARGFSFDSAALLDMRMDPALAVTAGDLVNGLAEDELYELFIKLGEERFARRFAGAICRARRLKRIETGVELAEIIAKALPRGTNRSRVHPATRAFQALRIAVNDELNALKEALPQSLALLKPEGRLVIISFHSLEDGIVKRFFLAKEKEGELGLINKKPIVPDQKEVVANPRARSAKLRAAIKLR